MPKPLDRVFSLIMALVVQDITNTESRPLYRQIIAWMHMQPHEAWNLYRGWFKSNRLQHCKVGEFSEIAVGAFAYANAPASCELAIYNDDYHITNYADLLYRFPSNHAGSIPHQNSTICLQI